MKSIRIALVATILFSTLQTECFWKELISNTKPYVSQAFACAKNNKQSILAWSLVGTLSFLSFKLLKDTRDKTISINAEKARFDELNNEFAQSHEEIERLKKINDEQEALLGQASDLIIEFKKTLNHQEKVLCKNYSDYVDDNNTFWQSKLLESYQGINKEKCNTLSFDTINELIKTMMKRAQIGSF